MLKSVDACWRSGSRGSGRFSVSLHRQGVPTREARHHLRASVDFAELRDGPSRGRAGHLPELERTSRLARDAGAGSVLEIPPLFCELPTKQAALLPTPSGVAVRAAQHTTPSAVDGVLAASAPADDSSRVGAVSFSCGLHGAWTAPPRVLALDQCSTLWMTGRRHHGGNGEKVLATSHGAVIAIPATATLAQSVVGAVGMTALHWLALALSGHASLLVAPSTQPPYRG